MVVVGGGPAGLATSAALRSRGIGHVVLERGTSAGHTWMHLYDSLTLHTGKHLSTLPGMSFDRRVPIFPSRGGGGGELKSPRGGGGRPVHPPRW